MHSACEKPVGKDPGEAGFLHRSNSKKRFATFWGRTIGWDDHEVPVC